MENHTLVALGVAMFALMAVSFYFTVRAYRKKQTSKEQRDDVTLHVRLGAKPEETEAARDLRTDLTATQAERDNFKALWEQARKEREITVKQRDEARALANDLREYLDRALKIVNEQNQQIQQFTGIRTQGWNGKVAARDSKGRFIPAPTPVKHLREMNAEFDVPNTTQP